MRITSYACSFLQTTVLPMVLIVPLFCGGVIGGQKVMSYFKPAKLVEYENLQRIPTVEEYLNLSYDGRIDKYFMNPDLVKDKSIRAKAELKRTLYREPSVKRYLVLKDEGLEGVLLAHEMMGVMAGLGTAVLVGFGGLFYSMRRLTKEREKEGDSYFRQ